MNRSEKSLILYHKLLDRGYPEPFCKEISSQLNTDYTAQRMLGYLQYLNNPRLEEIVDEMLAILDDRQRIIQKKAAFAANGRWNQLLQESFGDGEDLVSYGGIC